MRKLILLLMFVPIMSWAQNFSTILDKLPISNNDVIYTNVVKDSTLTADKIYLAAKKWTANLPKLFLESESAIQLDDKESGSFVVKLKLYIPDYDNPFYASTYATQIINIQAKNGRYKYIIDGIFIDYANKQFPDIKSGLPIKAFIDPKSQRLEYNKELLFFVDKKEKEIIASLIKTINNEANQEDW